jgi:hypothetical protein
VDCKGLILLGKEIPEFKNEDEERNFWAAADSMQYVDWPSGKRQLGGCSH